MKSKTGWMADEGTFSQFQVDPSPWIPALAAVTIREAEMKRKMDDLCQGLCRAFAVAYPCIRTRSISNFRMRGIDDRTRIRK
jgi:hypothetical protein